MSRLRQLGLAMGAAVAVLGSALFISWKYFHRKRRCSEEEYEVIKETDARDKQILVLGLDGAGKTSILNCLATSKVKRSTAPTQGFNAMCIHTGDCKLDFLEIGGSYNLRSYWNLYLSRAQLLVYVVDAADHERLPLAKQELHKLLKEDPQLPLVLLANKQDVDGALNISELHRNLSLHNVNYERKLFLMATNVTQDGTDVPKSIYDAKQVITQLVMPK
ncbi:ADP-ribosylation factor-like protein 9 [Callorhinchus milii]|uniref:ADP-ribosylation factor-like protein 9 n=2 Tax=Callorhinchus milii TaxID=7868 RepID=A0A4W3K840_CALMI|nr:ADP-ribosylation factor-like protein 9 [Callorhinchus milii]|eukprot:gi/632975802/ref/XP_007904431.1/ PREDICTED: ADP-ribosylation factor-like protein 10 [Callorhinchus milii]